MHATPECRQHCSDCEDARLATAFLRPLKAQFYVPEGGGKCTSKRLIDCSLNPPMPEEIEARELKSVAENLVCSMRTSVDGQKRYFHLKLKTVFPLRACHLLLRCSYQCKEGAWKELAFSSKLSVRSKAEVTLFWARKDRVQRDTSYRDRYHVRVDFDLVNCDWLPLEYVRCESRACQASLNTWDCTASPKKSKHTQDMSDTGRHPDSNLIVEVEGQRLHTFCDILTVASPVLARILSQASAVDGFRKVVRLPGKSATEVEELLKLLHPATPHRLSLGLAPAVLALADEYQIDNIKETAEGLIAASFSRLEEHHGLNDEQDGNSENFKRFDMELPCPMEGYALARTYNCARLELVCLRLLMGWSVERIEGSPTFRRMDKEDRCALAMARMRLMESLRQ